MMASSREQIRQWLAVRNNFLFALTLAFGIPFGLMFGLRVGSPYFRTDPVFWIIVLVMVALPVGYAFGLGMWRGREELRKLQGKGNGN